jgi:hypothetical protein
VDSAHTGYIPDVFAGTFSPFLNWKKLLTSLPALAKSAHFLDLLLFSHLFCLPKIAFKLSWFIDGIKGLL